jgi:hypothetical protein
MEPQLESEQIPDETVKEKPAITILVQSWATPIVGLAMLIVGLFGGYAIRPMINAQSEPPDVSLRGQQSSQDGAGAASNPQLMEYLVSQTRHFRGDPDAPVTLIEFGDFQ